MREAWPRCPSISGDLQCQGQYGHEEYGEPHWAEVGKPGALLRWGMKGYGCSDLSCVRKPGHPLPHRDGRGTSWEPAEVDNEYLYWRALDHAAR